MKEFYAELSKGLKNVKNMAEFSMLKNKLLRKYKLEHQPSYIQILTNINPSLFSKLKFIQTKPTRTISGVAPVAIMTKPYACPHGKCTYCPGGIKSFFGSVPQSYTGHEPASMRAKRNFYDPYLQVFNRLEQYALLNHSFDKVELIIMGGTFLSMPSNYQNDFVLYSFKAMNDFSSIFFKNNEFNFIKFKKFFELPADVHDKDRVSRLQKKILALKKDSNLEKEHLRNEKSSVRCVTLAMETRPDYGKLKHGNELLRFGTTRVEIGVQSVYDDILKKVKRGHTTKDTIKSFQILKDLGFKITAHYMPGLCQDKKRELLGLKELFNNPDYRPDMLKIYPCMVLKGTELYSLWQKGEYKQMTLQEAAELISEFKRIVPKYVRISRVQRDIPTHIIDASVGNTNLRQYVQELLEKKGIECKCIRCRESGRATKINKVQIVIERYIASKGIEYFISAEDKKNNILIGFCRLRIPNKCLRKEINKKSALIRELHVYSSAVGIGKKAIKGQLQHKGFGRLLLKKAAEIAKRNKRTKLVVIAGVGVRSYFYKLGYKKDGVYVSKKL